MRRSTAGAGRAARRLSTIKNVDRILVIHKDRLVEEGTHDELLRRGGIYSNLYALHNREMEISRAG